MMFKGKLSVLVLGFMCLSFDLCNDSYSIYTSGISESKSQIINNLFDTNENLPSREILGKALNGYQYLRSIGAVENNKLSIIDFTLSSNTKRLWVIDLDEYRVSYHTLVAHGKNSGDEYATKFSDKSGSYMSSLGFYLTAETYMGKHGKSLRLDGMEPGVNGNARDRAIVMHWADYVSKDFIKKYGRLGRSFGCPSLPTDIHEKVIDEISNGSCIFIYANSKNYLQSSPYINQLQ